MLGRFEYEYEYRPPRRTEYRFAEYRFAEYRFAEYEYEGIRCEARTDSHGVYHSRRIEKPV